MAKKVNEVKGKKSAVKNYVLEGNNDSSASYDMDAILDNEDDSSKAMSDTANFDRVSFPPMVKPNDIPAGHSIRGVLVSIRPSSKFEKQQILLLRATKTGQEISVPAVRGIGVYLFDKETGELKDGIIGKELIICRKGTKYSEKNKKNYPVFDVSISKKPVDKVK